MTRADEIPHPPRHTDAMTMAGLNLIQQALSIYDSSLRLVVCNRPFREMFDLPSRLVTPGADFAETIRFLAERGEYGPLDDLDSAVQARVDQARAFSPHYMERTRPDGRTISVEGSPLPQGGWVTVYTDISHVKRQEALLRARSEELSDQLIAHAEDLSATNRKLESTIAALEEAKRQVTEIEARTRLTTEMMPAHIAHIGEDGRYSYSNRRLASVLPGRPRQIIGLTPLEALGRQAFEAIAPNLDEAFQGRASVREFTHEDSSRRIRAAFTPDGAGGVYILSMDVTEETQARVALQQTRRREIAAQLTSGLAHDFANLLTIILGMQAQLQKMPLEEPAGALVAATQAAARRGGTLLNRIADITGARAVRLRPTNMAEFLSDLATLANSALPPEIGLKIDNALDHPVLMLDDGMVQDSLLNLVLNARDACGTGGGEITIALRALRDTWLEIEVGDTGSGFSDEALRHALEPFFSTKGDEGSGLGLAMVYDMAKLCGGRVRLSNAERGARVSLRLPLRVHDAEAAPPETEGGLVLLVEDSPDLRASLRDMLRDLGHSVIEAASVEEALALLRALPTITAILSDITLEGSATGPDLLEQLRADGARALACVLMTSLPADHPQYSRAAALAPVLRKPFGAPELAAALHAQRRDGSDGGGPVAAGTV